MNKKMCAFLIMLSFMLVPLVTISPVMATDSFSDVDFDEPHDNYTDTPPVYYVNTSPEQPWKKSDIDFTGSIGDSDEYSIGFSKEISLGGTLPGDLAAVEGSVEIGFEIGIRYDITFGYEFGVDYYHWANDMAVSEGQDFSYCSYVEPDPDTFSLWADISIEPFMKMWADIDVYLELAGFEIVDWEKKWSLDLSLPISISPNLDLGALLEADILTPIGDLYSSPKVGLGLELPGRLEYSIGDYAGVYFDAGIGVYAQFQIRGLLESLLELTGDANAKFDDGKSELELKYYDTGKENLKSIDIHVPVSSAGKVVEILAHEFEYSIEPGLLLSWDGHLDVGAYLHIPTPTKCIEVARTVTETVCEWLPWPLGKVCDTVTDVVFDFVEVAATIVPDIDWDWDYTWEAEDEWWIPFFTIPLLKSNSQALDRIKVLQSTEYPLSIDHNWGNTWNDNWTLDIGPSALRLSAYAGYALNLALEGMLYSYYKPDDQIAGHPFNYYAGVDGDDAGDGSFGGSLAAGYSLELKIPYMDELIGQDVWIELIGYDFNTSEFSGLDIPLASAEYSVGVVAISLSSEAKFADLDDLEIAQSANGFLGTWETEPFFTISASLDGMLFQVLSMNLGSLDVEFLFKGTGDLTGDISASGAGSFPSTQMQWDDPGDINYANIYPNANAEKGDNIDVLIENLKYNLDLDLVIRVTAKLYALYGYLEFSHDFEIDLLNSLEADVNEVINEQIEVTAGFNPAKIIDIPEEVTAGEPFLIHWETSNSTSGQTRLQYGKTPYPRYVYSDATSYQSITGGGIHEFNDTIILNKTGTWYFLAHLQSTTPPFDFYTKNLTVRVKPRINITSIPQNATAGESVTIDWNIFGPSSVESTNLRYSESPNPMSDPGIGTTIKSGGAGPYSTQITFDEVGTYYLVAHAQVDKEGDDYFSEIVSIQILPNITITVLPSPNNASFEFIVNWSIKGADYIDRTYLEYSQNASFSEGVFSTISQYGYSQNYDHTVALYVKGPWYFRVLASVNGISGIYYSKEPFNITIIDPYSEINPTYPLNVTVGESFKLYWWVFGYNTSVNKTQIFYDNDTNVFDEPIGSTMPYSGNTTDFSDTFSINTAGRYYFQANFSVDGEGPCWYSDQISILVTPTINITAYPVNATAFTNFAINYTIDGADVDTTNVDLWYGETDNISSMTRLTQGMTGGTILGAINITGLYYFAVNLSIEGFVRWSQVVSFQIVPYIEVLVPWDQITDVDFNKNPTQFAIAGIPVIITWQVSNVTTVNHTDIHFRGEPGYEPELKFINPTESKYIIVHNQISGWMSPEQTGQGSHTYFFMQNVTFYVKEFTWVKFIIHLRCDNKTYDYYSNGSAIPVYPAAEAVHYNYSVVVDKLDIGLNPQNFSVTWAMGYVLHTYIGSGIYQNTPNIPGYVPYKVTGIKHANIHYMLNYDPLCSHVFSEAKYPNSTRIRSGSAYPGKFTDNITISSVGTYYFRIHVQYTYNSTYVDNDGTCPQHINRSYWSPLYKINVIFFGKYNTTVQAPKSTPPPAVSYADYDGDGDLDMMVGDSSMPTSRRVVLYFNDGTGNYTALPSKEILSYTTIGPEEIVSITAGHLNNDNYLDFVMTNESLPSADRGYVYLNDGQCNFTYKTDAFNGASASAYLLADISGDGIYDYLYFNYDIFELTYNVGTTDGDHTTNLSFTFDIVETIDIADLDPNSNDVMIGLMNGSFGIFLDFPYGPLRLNQNVSATFNDFNRPIWGDFNNDGANDTIVVNASGEVILTLNATTSALSQVVSNAAGAPQGIATGDLDSDGDLDFIIGLGANRFQFFFSNNSLGPFTFPGFSNQIYWNGGDVFATGDFNNDSRLDISAYRADFHMLHFIQGYITPPTISGINVTYNYINQTIDITNVTATCSEHGVINNTNAYVHLYSILNSTFELVRPVDNLTWNGATWEALNVNVTYLPEGNYYVNVTFGDFDTVGNNSVSSVLATEFTIDHYDRIHGVGVSYIGNTLQKLNITVDIVNSTYTELGNITGLEATIHSYIIRNATGHYVLVQNETVTGNFSYGMTTGIYRWEAINVSTAELLPGDYFVTVNFSDYLGYDTVEANSTLFTVEHVLISTTVPDITYEGNLTQMIKIRNIHIESSYTIMRILGKGQARIFNCSIYNNNTQAFTGIGGALSNNGFNWYADVSVSALPEGSYYINAFFKDAFNATVTTTNTSVFTVNHTLDLSSLEVVYTGYMVQTFNIIITPESTYDSRGILNDTEALNRTYYVYSLNGTNPILVGSLEWNGYNWTKVVDVSQLLEGDYLVQVNFADIDANVTQNSSLLSIYHYIGITQPTFEYNSSTFEFNMTNIIATSSFHGMVNLTTVVPTICNFTIVSSHVGGNITGSFEYNSPWHKTGINLSSLIYSSNFTIYIEFEVNESYGLMSFEVLIPPERAPQLNAILPNPDENVLIFLNWDDVNGTTLYYIYRDTNPISSIQGMTPIATSKRSSYQDTVPSEATYYYVVVAGNPAGNTSISNYQSVVVDFPEGGGIPGFELIFVFFGIITLLIYYFRKKSPFFLNRT